MSTQRTWVAEPLTQSAFAPFGNVLEAHRPDASAKPANMGTARRFDWLAAFDNLRPETARANVCVFRCTPQRSWPFAVTMLEHHPHATQIFFPLAASRYVVLVALSHNGAPDLATVRAFVATGRQGIAYLPGTWHHPLLALDDETDFGCLVYEDESEGDVSTYTFDPGGMPRVHLA